MLKDMHPYSIEVPNFEAIEKYLPIPMAFGGRYSSQSAQLVGRIVRSEEASTPVAMVDVMAGLTKPSSVKVLVAKMNT